MTLGEPRFLGTVPPTGRLGSSSGSYPGGPVELARTHVFVFGRHCVYVDRSADRSLQKRGFGSERVLVPFPIGVGLMLVATCMEAWELASEPLSYGSKLETPSRHREKLDCPFQRLPFSARVCNGR